MTFPLVLPGQEQYGTAVNSVSEFYAENLPDWTMIEALICGSRAMRAAGTIYLPQERLESDTAYATRLIRSHLFPGFERGTARLAAKPFSREVQTTGKDGAPLPPAIQWMLEDVDGHQFSWRNFLEQWLLNAIRFGAAHVLVDMPEFDNLTRDEEIKQRVAPQLTLIPPPSLLNTLYTRDALGRRVLSSVAIAEYYEDTSRSYASCRVPAVRIYAKDSWQLFVLTKDAKGEEHFTLKNKGPNRLGQIPIVSLYTNRVGPFEATSPMQALAELNITHWQSNSDQRSILRFARLGTFFFAGLSQEDLEKISLGPSGMVSSPDPEAKGSILEHTGAAATVGRMDVEDLERKMELLAMEPLLAPVISTSSATGEVLDDSKIHSVLQGWVLALAAAAERVIKMAGKWTGQPNLEPSVDIYNEFLISPRIRDDVLALIELRARHEITQRTLLAEVQRRTVISLDCDLEREIEETKEEKEAAIAAGTASMQSKGVPRFGGTGGGVREDLNDSNGGKSRRRKDRTGRSMLPGSTDQAS